MTLLLWTDAVLDLCETPQWHVAKKGREKVPRGFGVLLLFFPREKPSCLEAKIEV